MADLKLGYLAIEEAIKGIRDDATTRSPILLYDDVTGDTIVRALDTGGTVLFQNAAGAALSFAVAWAAITSKPTSIAGYAITDAYTDAEVDAGFSAIGHVHTFASLTSKPTTIVGYGIADAYTEGEVDTLLAGKSATGHTHAAADIASGVLPFARGGLGFATIAKGEIPLGTATDTLGKLAVPATDGWVLTWDTTTGLPVWEAPTGGLADAFASVTNSAGTEQFAASGASALRFTAGADIGITFDAVDKEVIIAFTGSVSGITRGYADITGDSGASAAVGADTLIIAGAGGITTAATSAPDTLTITLGNHSAALLTTGTLPDARIQATGVTQHQASLSIAATQLTGNLAIARFNSGTSASSSTFWRGDGTWVAAGGSTSASDLVSGNLAYALLPTGSGSWDVGVGNTTTITRAVALGSTLAVTGVSTLTGNVLASVIRQATSDGSDTGLLSLLAGGGSNLDSSRGAGIQMYGNEHGSTGKLYIECGAVAGAIIYIRNDAQTMIEVTRDSKLGFFGAAPVTQRTGVAVTAAGIHTALVSLGFITA